MKKLLLSCLLLSLNAFAADYEIKITNETEHEVSFGSYRGIPFPSLCEDGWCLDQLGEVFISKWGFRKFQGTKVASVSYSDFEKREYVIRIGNVKHVGIYSCEQAKEYDLPRVGAKLVIDMSSQSAYCVDEGFSEIEINI